MLKELEQQEKDLLVKLKTIRDVIAKERLRIAEQDFGVRDGSVVKDRRGIEYKVTRVFIRYRGKPWLEGNPKKKDGTFGKARRNIYDDWTLVST